MTNRLSVIVPVYGNETTLRELKDRLSTTLRTMEEIDYELIFVDDASLDGSWGVIKTMAALDPRVVGVRLASNVGQMAAYCAGVSVAAGEVLISIDADLEHPPEAIPRLVRAFWADHDLVVARRIGRSPGTIRLLGSRTVNLLARILRLSVSDVGSSFLVCTPEVAAAMREMVERTGRQMLLPAVFDAACNPTAIDVELSTRPTSAYRLGSVVGLFGEFLAAEVGPPLARRMLLASGCILVLGVHPRFRRAAARWGMAVAGLGFAGLLAPLAFRRDRTESLYLVATRVGRGLGS